MEKILIIDDDRAFAQTLKIFLSDTFPLVHYVTSGEEGIEYVKKEIPDVVLTDLKMPNMGGLDVLKQIKEIDGSIAVIIITAFDETDSIIKAMQLGAFDFFEKSLDLKRIKIIVKKTLENKKKIDQMIIPLPDESEKFLMKNFMVGGLTEQMKDIFKKIGKVSGTRVNVLIQGESGTGKELITRMIHYSGITKNEPFVAVNCSALPESLLESELFGHVQGAFTGATKNKKGKFELAGKGSIFLDEISEFSPNLQVKLLRVIQEKEFERVGGEEIIQMQARIVAATNKNLIDLVEKGLFREDLFYRLNIFTITVPPLRERKEEIPKLVVHLLGKINLEVHKKVNTIPFEVMEMLKNHVWFGNIRELENTLMNAVLLAKDNVLEKEYFNFVQHSNHQDQSHNIMSLAESEKIHIQFILDHVKWNKSQASKILGITKTTLYNKISQYNLKESKS
ncbi:MAG: sigma-54 dependent transcriptional regulator [Bacteroidetes bacterium]|nr:sigma-54 dependent transcriptional regulator [Bacteroidota bacterium]